MEESHGRHHHQALHHTYESIVQDPYLAVDDSKLHVSHAKTFRTQIINPTMLWWRNARVSPAVLLALCIVSGFCGSWLQLATESLPTPTGGPVGVSSGLSNSGRRTLSLTSGGSLISSGGKGLSDPLQGELFQDWAFNASGFSAKRPALPAASSGENDMRVVPFQTISWYPRITYYPGFVDHERCEHIMRLAKKYMSPSALAYKPGDSIPESQDVRTSTGTFLSAGMDKDGVLDWLEDKIAAVTHLPVENGEAFNVLRYMPTQHYDSHYDSFDPKDFGKQYSQRIATLLLFLTDVEEGGETVFKREGKDNGNRTITDWRGCSDGVGVKVKPRQGDAVLFWSTKPDLVLDDHALHGACPVIKGEKWSMAKWIHEKPIGFPRHH